MWEKVIHFAFILTFVILIKPSTQDAIAAFEDALKAPTVFQKQLVNDLFLLRESVSELQSSLSEVNKQLNRQTEVIHEFKLTTALDENVIRQCEMEEFFQGIDGRLIKIKQKLQQAINNNDDDHMDKFDKIMHNVRRAAHDSAFEDTDYFDVLRKNITLKLTVLDKQLERLKDLEHKLFKTDVENLQTQVPKNELAKLQNEINVKLQTQEDKLTKFATFVPFMVNATQSMIEFKNSKKADCSKQKCISQKILELTSGNTQKKT